MRTETFIDIKYAYSGLEERYQAEYPFLTQTTAWKAGMRYRYSPDTYSLRESEISLLSNCGRLMGSLLDKAFRDKILEFRIDFMVDDQGQPWVTEVQTDDRGLPAMAIARNSKDTTQPEIFPGILGPLSEALKVKSSKSNPTLLIVYPEEEGFYYAGFSDLAIMLWAGYQIDAFPVPYEQILKATEHEALIKIRMAGLKMRVEPDLVWNFAREPLFPGKEIQTRVTKQLIYDIWKKTGPLSLQLREFVPRVTDPDSTEVVTSPERWVLKPIDGRWSQGVTFGFSSSEKEWEQAVKRPGQIAQRFIQPRMEHFYVRGKKPYEFSLEEFFARVEGYYIKDQDRGWQLADVLATCTSDLPVHGKRDCIMIAGQLTEVDKRKTFPQQDYG